MQFVNYVCEYAYYLDVMCACVYVCICVICVSPRWAGGSPVKTHGVIWAGGLHDGHGDLMCVYIYIYICIVCIHVYIHIYIYIHTHMCT